MRGRKPGGRGLGAGRLLLFAALLLFGPVCSAASTTLRLATPARDRTPPSAPTVRGPRSTSDHAPTFRFHSTDPDNRTASLRYRCSFDRPRLHTCATSFRYRLATGTHTLRVRALDPSGNASRIIRLAVVIKPLTPSPVGTIVARIPVPLSPHGIAVLPRSVWVAQHRAATVAKIDPTRNRVAGTVEVAQGDAQPARFAVGSDGKLWLAEYSGGGIVEIDPDTNTVLHRFAAPGETCCWPAFAAGALWVLNPNFDNPPAGGELVRVDAVDGHTTSYHIGGLNGGVTSAAGSLWVTAASNLVRIDPATGAILASVNVGLSADCCHSAGVFAAGALWLVDGSTVRRFDPSVNQVVATIRLPTEGCAAAGNDTALFVASCKGILWRIDPATNTLLGGLRLGYNGDVGDVEVGLGAVWVSMFDVDTLLRIVPR